MSAQPVDVSTASDWSRELDAARADQARIDGGISLPADADLWSRYGASTRDSWGAQQLAALVAHRLRAALARCGGTP